MLLVEKICHFICESKHLGIRFHLKERFDSQLIPEPTQQPGHLPGNDLKVTIVGPPRDVQFYRFPALLAEEISGQIESRI